MLSNELQRHRSEFLRALANHKYEQTNAGILFPEQKAIARGVYIHSVNGQDEREDPNIVVTEFLNYMLECALRDGTKLPNWYCAISTGNVSPQAAWTAANYATNATEITSNSDGYQETTRPAFSPAAASGGVADNYATRAEFNIELTTGSLTVWGAGILSSNIKGGTAGKLGSATKFTASRTLYDEDVFSVGYRITLTSA